MTFSYRYIRYFDYFAPHTPLPTLFHWLPSHWSVIVPLLSWLFKKAHI
jgi:hypothetical protein